MEPARVSIIIPTTCESKRRASLLKAIDSILAAADEPVAVILVVNGTRFDADLLESLRDDDRLVVIYESVGSAPRAQRIGREAVRTEFFGFLDDDDEYLAGALTLRRAHLDAHPEADGVVCNGVRFNGEVETPFLTDFASIYPAPLLALAETNWLASCGGLFRTARVGEDFFDERFRYIEWTLLGFKLALKRHLDFVDVPTFKINNTPQSLSKSEAYELAHIDVLQEILRLPLPAPVAARVRRKLGAAHHLLSDFFRAKGQAGQAWRHHLSSLRYPGGLDYLAYTRRLLWAIRPVGAS
ncbi:MAG: glycosyltransferase family 2 protein [Burkholderiales bacterium]|nr:glycosyltransferase family 2 protein [Burkholderiales bacterium]